MALKYVTYRTYQPLCCESGSQVVLSVTPSIALNGDYFLQSSIGSVSQAFDNAGQTFYQYEFSYDPVTQLKPSYQTLVQNDIGSVFCKNSQTDYIEQLVFDLRAEFEASDIEYFAPKRVMPDTDVGIISGLDIWTTPTNIKSLGSSFTNTSDKPVWILVEYESPFLSWDLVPGGGYGYVYSVTVKNDTVVVDTFTNKQLAGFTVPPNPTGSVNHQYFSVSPGKIGVGAGAYKVLPGKLLEVDTVLRIIPSGVADVDNEIIVLGPWITLVPFPGEA